MLAAAQSIETVSAWWYIVPPLIGSVFGAVTVIVALRPLYKERVHQRETRQDRETRWDRTADAVWGRDADLKQGVDQVLGLRPVVEDIHKTTKAIETKQRELTIKVDEHCDRDELAFRLLERSLRMLHPDAGDLLLGRRHEPGTPGEPH